MLLHFSSHGRGGVKSWFQTCCEGESSFLVRYPPFSCGEHVVERVPADAGSVEKQAEKGLNEIQALDFGNVLSGD